MNENPTKTQWKYLEERPDTGRKQLYIKGRKLRAFTIWMDMIVNEENPSDAAYNWDLPLEAVNEAIIYCQANQPLLEQEAQEERRYLRERGINLEPKVAN